MKNRPCLQNLLLCAAAVTACGDGMHFEAERGHSPTNATPAEAGEIPTTPRADTPVTGTPDLGEGGAIRVTRRWSEGLALEVGAPRFVARGEIELQLEVLDPRTGRPLDGFGAEHLRFSENGQDLGAETLFDIGRAQALEVVLVLDLSQSMAAAGAVDPLRRAAQTLVDALPAGARLGVVEFATEARTTQVLTTDTGELKNALEAATPPEDRAGRFTNLWGAVKQATTLFSETTEPPARVVFVFSDGRDNVAEIEFEAAKSAVVNAGAMVYAVGLGAELDADALTELAGTTRYTETTDPDALTSLFADVGARIGEVLTVRYTTPKAHGTHLLGVQVTEGSRAAGFDVEFTLGE
ncbi:MAG: VWA domain-containing protein [Myxococcales bacterium]|nr:VWA domain-containing protein [Myxococcales bacterium]